MSLFTFGFAVLLSSAAQGEAPPPAPASEVAPPPVSEVAPPPPVEPPPPVPPAGPVKPKSDANRPALEPEGMNGFVVGCLQWGLPCALAAVAGPLFWVGGFFCPALPCLWCAMPAANGYLATYLGDRLGKNRAPAIWPIVAAYAANLTFAVAVVVAYLGLFGGIAGLATGVNQLLGPAGLAVAGVGVGVLALSTLAVPVTYALTAEEKHAGDDGSALPGFMSPGHPAPPKKDKGANKPGTTVSAATRAMAF